MVGARNTIVVGSKLPMNYVMAVVHQFDQGPSEVLLKARGKAISRAVDVAEIVKHRFLEDVAIDNVHIGTERVVDEGGKPVSLSTIEIRLRRSLVTEGAATSSPGPGDEVPSTVATAPPRI